MTTSPTACRCCVEFTADEDGFCFTCIDMECNTFTTKSGEPA